MNFALIIPARYNSKRLHGKLLKKINGVAVLKHVYNKCKLAVDENKVFVASADQKIISFCKDEKIKYFKTPRSCKTGTDRIIYLANKLNYDFFINVQGDEVFVNPNSIKQVVKETSINFKKNYIINCYTKIKSNSEFISQNVPKVIFDNNNYLLYMSRAPIPSSKVKNFNSSNKQVCIYGYPTKVMKPKFFNKKTKNEKIEDIEILRFLDSGNKIKMIYVKGSEIAIDTLKDLKNARKILKE